MAGTLNVATPTSWRRTVVWEILEIKCLRLPVDREHQNGLALSSKSDDKPLLRGATRDGVRLSRKWGSRVALSIPPDRSRSYHELEGGSSESYLFTQRPTGMDGGL
ncbi:hypothetical protein HZH68_005157 [Vespula germanica]|uniref:Uncharacterized protein n=1 Tax=Vespula germanica TaxID=30212 RepID=A0A834KFJ9_VESGE|nr:hypothetical protein HZH68_005157 [Vespula germanica]